MHKVKQSLATFSDPSNQPYYQREEFKRDLNSIDYLDTSVETKNKDKKKTHLSFDYLGCRNSLDVKFFTGLVCRHINVRKKYGVLDDVDLSNDWTRNKTNLSSLILKLSEQLEEEQYIERLERVVKLEESTDDKRLLGVSKMMFDSMHLVNRRTERLLKVLFTIGAVNAIGSQEAYKAAVE